ncbi:unnamed protein product [Clonostachys rhizophaga]|uniref:Uncharacterized protein n=1 Tax=Clonostachys rhizophaga TaxID=160324 RepID=A0A9N9VL62_9HYPO|nr:unnamed protein product [Clonostachys rhizophaga]
MHSPSLLIFLALVFLFGTLKDGLIQRRSQAGPTQRISSSVNAEQGQRDYSGNDLAHDLIKKKSGSDYSFQPLFKRQGSCKDGQTACGPGCMPENADCCSGKTYCIAGTIDCDHKYSCLYVIINIGCNDSDKSTINNNNKFAITNRNGYSILHHKRDHPHCNGAAFGRDSGNGTTSTGIIAGATVGGVVAGALAMGALWLLFRRQK